MKHLFAILITVIIGSVSMATPPPYDNPLFYRINKVNPHVRNYPAGEPAYRIQLNEGWLFFLATSLNAIPSGFTNANAPLYEWRSATVPSVWQEEGIGCYVRDISLPASWKGRRTFIKFGAVSTAMHLYVNGQQVGYSEDSYTPAEWEITRYLAEGSNRIAMRVYSTSDGASLEYNDEQTPSFGLLRDVELYSLPTVYIADYHAIATLDTADYATALLDLTIDLSSEVKRPYHVEMEIADTTGGLRRTLLRRRQSLAVNEWFVSFAQKDNRLGQVRPWSPSTPHCYQMTIRLLDEQGNAVHSIVAPLGFRSIRQEQGLWTLNGKPLTIRGVNWHDSRVGIDMCAALHSLRECGFNAVMLDRPEDESFYDCCDAIGLMVWNRCGMGIEESLADEIANSDDWADAIVYRAYNLMRRDRNHACVAAWGIYDAMPWGENTDLAMRYFRSHDAERMAAHQLDERGAAQITVNPTAYTLTLYATRFGDWRKQKLAIYDASTMDAGMLSECWDTIVAYPKLMGAFCGYWDEISYDDRRMLRRIFARIAPDEVMPDPNDIDEMAETVEEPAPAEEAPIKKRKRFFLLRWIDALFGR